MQNIINRMRQLYPVSDEAVALFTSHLEKKIIPPRTIIIEGGKIDRHVYFIERGITRSFSLFNGKEVTTWFSMEGDGTCSSFSLYRSRPGFEYVETLEEVEAYVLSTDALTALYARHIDLANWGRVLQQENFLRMQDMYLTRLNLPAQERYEKMTKEFPRLCNRVNLGYIASFLGITQPTLSHIRGRQNFLT